MRSLPIALVICATVVAAADAAPSGGRIELGFVRGRSILLASRDGTHQRVVLRGGRRSTYGSPAWSRSGRLAATRFVEPDEGHGYDEVVVVDPGRAPVTLRANAADSPTWAPDDRRLALMENYRGDGGGTICVAEVGRVCRDLSHDPPLGPYVEDSPTWSPNGRWIAYARGKLGPRGVELKLFMIHPDGTGRRRLTARSIENPSWSPDGHRIAFDDGRDIYVLNIDGSGTRRLTHAKAIETDPAWSPDGSQIAFQRARSSGSNRSDVWVADARGAHARLLIRNAQQPAWKGG